MRYLLIGSILAMGAAFTTPAMAAKYKCSCYDKAKAGLEASSDPKMQCVDTFSNFDNSSSVQESHLKIYVDSDNKVQSDKDAEIRFRPRDGHCLNEVDDGNAESVKWVGAYCNNDSYKTIGGFKLKSSGTNWTAAFKAKTDGKHYKGFLLYAENDKKYMQAACLEDR